MTHNVIKFCIVWSIFWFYDTWCAEAARSYPINPDPTNLTKGFYTQDIPDDLALERDINFFIDRCAESRYDCISHVASFYSGCLSVVVDPFIDRESLQEKMRNCLEFCEIKSIFQDALAVEAAGFPSLSYFYLEKCMNIIDAFFANERYTIHNLPPWREKLEEALKVLTAQVINKKNTLEALIKESRGSSIFEISDSIFHIKSLSAWITACETLSCNRSDAVCQNEELMITTSVDSTCNGFWAAGLPLALDRLSEIRKAIYIFSMQKKAQLCSDQAAYWDEKPVKENTFNFNELYSQVSDETNERLQSAYVEKQNFPEGVKLYMHGDYHGDIISLVAFLKDLQQKNIVDDHFRVIDQHAHFIFLGDYVDRGWFGSEVMYTILRFAITNPDRVLLVRGNHETRSMNKVNGFLHELKYKFNEANFCDDGRAVDLLFEMNTLYSYLPLAFYVGSSNGDGGTDYVQCCHGGLEPKYTARIKHFLTTNKRYTVLPNCCENNGFMWTDFQYDASAESACSTRGAGMMCYSKADCEQFLRNQSSPELHIFLKSILRGHQHIADGSNPLMLDIVASKGVYTMWHPIEDGVGDDAPRLLNRGVLRTLNVAPDSSYGAVVGFDFDTHIAVMPRMSYDRWSICVYNKVIQQLLRLRTRRSIMIAAAEGIQRFDRLSESDDEGVRAPSLQRSTTSRSFSALDLLGEMY